MHINKLIAEFLGSLFLVMAAIGSRVMIYYRMDGGAGLALVANAIAVGWVLYALIELFGPISGAHFNPVVTLVMAMDKQLEKALAWKYLAVQLVGGILGTFITKLMFYDDLARLFLISDNHRGGSRHFSELIATFILVFAILVLVKMGNTKIPMIVGMLVGGMILTTSSTMFANPQVTIARIFTDTVSGIRPLDAIIYVIMQVLGALLAYGLYQIMSKKGDLKP